MTLGQLIRKMRKDKGYTLEALSMESGIPISTISGWERDAVVPTVTLLCCIADVLEVTLDKLLDRNVSFGEWVKGKSGELVCSQCGARPLFMKNGNMIRRVRTPHCPVCGIGMRGVE